MSNVEKFKYWCNKILPLVYDDSLSYYEFLGKVYEKLNETIDAVNSSTEAVAEFDQRINDFIAAETAARDGWENQQERDRQSWETTETANRAAWERQQTQKYQAFMDMFVNEYDQEDTYTEGDVCSYDGKMYVANGATSGSFHPNKWDEIVLAEYLADYVQTAATSLQTQYNDFLANYQRQFGVIDNLDGSPTDAISTDAVYTTVGKNLVDPSDPDFTIGGFHEITNTWTANANLCETGFIPCRPAQKIYRVTPSGATTFSSTTITFYDSTKTFVTGVLATGDYATVPSNNDIRFFRMPVGRPTASNNYQLPALYFSAESTIQPLTQNGRLYREIETGDFLGLLFDQTNGNLINENDQRNKDGYYWSAGEWVENANYKSYYIPLKFGKMLFCYLNGEQKFPGTTIPVFDASNNFLYEFNSSESTSAKLIGKGINNDTLPHHCFVSFHKLTTNQSVIWYEPITADRKRYTLNTVKNEITQIQQILETLDPDISHWNGKNWFAYGTSITSIEQGKYVSHLAAFSGLIATNKGIPGGGIGNLGAYSTGQVYSAICNVTDGKLTADLITLETGANDVTASVPLGTIYDTGTTTLAGCLNDCIRYLQANTTAQVVIIESPTGTTEPEANNQIWKWHLMMRDICKINCVTFIPIESNVGYAKQTSSQGSNYIVDNIHQTNLGGYIYAEAIWKYLKNVPTFKTALP